MPTNPLSLSVKNQSIGRPVNTFYAPNEVESLEKESGQPENGLHATGLVVHSKRKQFSSEGGQFQAKSRVGAGADAESDS